MLPVKSFFEPNVKRFFEEDWNNLFDWPNLNFSETRSTLPAVNIMETPEKYVVEMAAPGLDKSDFQIELHDDVLTISSEARKSNALENGERFARREFSYLSFRRTFNLNKRVVDEGAIEATYQNGILKLNLPKREEAKEKPVRVIEIS